MTTKSGKLMIQEKRRIEELIKCRRDRQRQHLVEALGKKREAIEKPYTEKIEKLQREAEDIRKQREEMVMKAGYGKIYERGCYDTHPELDAFDAETNKQLVELWKTSDPVEGQFTEQV